MLQEKHFSRQNRVLSADAFLYVALLRDYTVVPVWSPEVAFLFDPQISAVEARRRLAALGIVATDYDFNLMVIISLIHHSNLFADIAAHPQNYRPLFHSQYRAIVWN